LETGSEYEDLFSWENPSNRALFLQRNILFHSSVCYSSKFVHLEYPLEGEIAADYGLWLAILKAGGRFMSLDAPQFRYYGDNLTSVLRVSVPSLPPVGIFQQCIQDIFDSRVLSNRGRWCSQFEESVSTYLDVPYAITTGSGDTALIMAFQVLQSIDRKRREVILPSYTFPSTANALLWNRYTPVFCDIDPRSLCITPKIVEPLISADTAAIVAVHAHGNPCDMEGLETLAAKHKIRLIADAAPAFSARIGERKVGSFGDMEVFSLSGTKILTSGEGGVICCRDEAIAQLLRRIGRYGLSSDYTCIHLGVNGKFAEIPAALATIQLPMLNSLRDKREQVAHKYQQLLETVPDLRFQTASSPHAVSAWKDFALILPSREQTSQLSDRLRAYRIDSRPYYRPLHSMPAFSQYKRGVLDVTEKLSDCVLCVPFYADIRKEVISLIAEVVQEVFSK
jgi:dTDP-4-amino-4,6-dideoxygalactose transaminase